MKPTKKHIFIKYIALTAFSFLVWWPVYFLITSAFTPQDELIKTIGAVQGLHDNQAFLPIIPTWPTLQPFTELLFDTPNFFTVFWNTCKMTFPQVLGHFIIGAPAAWAFSRFRFRGRKILFTVYMILMLMPFQVLVVPNYLVVDALNLNNTIWAVILPSIFSTFPVFIMASGFDHVPRALLEAASLDGASHFRIFIKIGLPLGLPSIISALILSFLESFSAIEQPMIFLQDVSLWPLSLYLPQIATENLAISATSSLIALLPTILIFRYGQKYLELGIQSSGIKE